MQSYQYQADVARQQYGERLKEKDHEVQTVFQSHAQNLMLFLLVAKEKHGSVMFSELNFIIKLEF